MNPIGAIISKRNPINFILLKVDLSPRLRVLSNSGFVISSALRILGKALDG
jgi:hypothetical protein